MNALAKLSLFPALPTPRRTVGQNWVLGLKPSYLPQLRLDRSIKVINALLYYYESTVKKILVEPGRTPLFWALKVSALATRKLCFVNNMAKVGKC